MLGLAGAAAYIVFSALAAWQFPGHYSPWNNNTLSQLGNDILNPTGAIYYQIGCAVTGILIMAFFATLGSWRATGSRVQKWLLSLVQILGVVAGFGLFMTAIFPKSNLPPHHFWAGVVFNGFGAGMLLVPFALWRPGMRNLPVTFLTLSVFLAVIIMFVFSAYHSVEWVPVIMFLLSPGFLGLHTRSHHFWQA